MTLGLDLSSMPSGYKYLQDAVYNVSSANLEKNTTTNTITRTYLHESNLENKNDSGTFPIVALDTHQSPKGDNFQAVSVDGHGSGSVNASILFQSSTMHALSRDPISNQIVARVLNISQVFDSIWVIKQLEGKTSNNSNAYRIHPLLDTDKCVTQVNPVSGGSGSGFFSGISGSSNSSTLEIKPCIDQGNTSDTDQDFIFTSVSTGSTNITINVNL